ncbi:MAG TPA: hypothetical protein VL981_07340 [Candidatus Methylacidiphilales bacterium]|nr:hypothetical protein [Candidatus Methylacidiphilales bacterium]
MKIKTFLCASVVAGLIATPGIVKAEDNDVDGQTVAWGDVPAAVQSTITSNANGGTVSEVEKETKGNAVVYEADVTGSNGKKFEIKVASDGTLIKVKTDDDDDKNEGGKKDGDKD